MDTRHPTQHTGTDLLSSYTMALVDEAATKKVSFILADLAAPGLCILLNGPVGVGKSFLARAIIQTLMARHGVMEDVPSPTFTLVQQYEFDSLDVWHADLYRLTNSDELFELGLEQAFGNAFCLIEWPEKLGSLRPTGCLELILSSDPSHVGARSLQANGPESIIMHIKNAPEFEQV